ncbi:T9SS type A sorting domain-containing protein [Winogradskyella litorisediminis]|uniref:T9SS type A sorting domain-containing protein n=1 Tax=Winogradskyella litorisediminis TaxID=1156618 RepID=A0ABW3N659_9FLAO
MKIRLLFAFSFILNFLYTQAPTDYIGRYNFDNGSLADEANGIGNLNNPSGQPSNYSVTTGWDNTANSAIDVVNVLFTTGAFPQIAQEYSYSFWLNTTSNISSDRDIFKRLNNNQGVGTFMQSGGITIQLENGKVKGYVRPVQNNTGGILASAETNVIADGNWHHIVITVKQVTNGNLIGWEIEAFQDGVSISSAQTNFYFSSQNPSITTSNQPLFVGSNVQSFIGIIDDIRIFDRGLSLQEVIETQNDPGVVIFSDANFKSWFVNNNLINTNGSSEIEFAEAVAYTGTVVTPNLGVLDILGIEEFPNITGIDVSNNQISSADFSKNISLTSVDVSNNSLTFFNLKNNNNTAIVTYNSVGNPNLTCVLVDYFNYSNNNWTSKDSQTNFSTTCSNSQIYVDADATGANDGTSWINAYTNLATALSNNPNSKFWVAQGIYKASSNDRTLSFDLTASQEIYGGFDGTEIDLSQRDIDANETILSGDINGTDDSVLQFNTSAYGDNTYQIINIVGDNVVLDGITIKGGNANAAGFRTGAAINISQTVKNVEFNRLLIEDNRVNDAGVVYFNQTSAQTGDYNYNFTNCIFRNNLGRFATVYYASNPRTSGTIKTTFTNCLFYDNVVADVPAYNQGTNTLFWFRTDVATTQIGEFINCTISSNDFNATNNSASVISASRIGGTCTARLYNSVLWDNKRASDGNEHSTIGGFGSQSVGNRIVRNSIAPSFSSGIAQNSSTADPLLAVFPDKYKYRIGNASSPAIDFGDNTYLPASAVGDLLNNNRIFNSIVDAGAYEFGAMSLSSSDSEAQIVDVKLYPNPTSNILNIKTNNQQIKQIAIYDILGKQVLRANNSNINVSHLKSGIYILKAKTTLGQVVKRFIKQ